MLLNDLLGSEEEVEIDLESKHFFLPLVFETSHDSVCGCQEEINDSGWNSNSFSLTDNDLWVITSGRVANRLGNGKTNFNKNFDRRYEQMLKPRTVHEVYTKAIFCCLQILDSIKPVNLNRPLVITHKSLSVNEKELEFHPLSNYFLLAQTPEVP